MFTVRFLHGITSKIAIFQLLEQLFFQKATIFWEPIQPEKNLKYSPFMQVLIYFEDSLLE